MYPPGMTTKERIPLAAIELLCVLVRHGSRSASMPTYFWVHFCCPIFRQRPTRSATPAAQHEAIDYCNASDLIEGVATDVPLPRSAQASDFHFLEIANR